MIDTTELRLKLLKTFPLFQNKSFGDNNQFIDVKNLCKKCKRGKLIQTAKQIRSADEGMTMFLICNYCNFQQKK